MKKFAFLTVILWVNDACSQLSTNTGWLASFNTFHVAKKWSLHLDVQFRTTDDWEQLQTLLVRPGLNWHVRPNQVITLGYAFIPNRFSIGTENALVAEHRMWQQFIVNQKLRRSSLQHRFRLEERFIPKVALQQGEITNSGTKFSTRLRYFARAVVPISGEGPFKKGAFVALQNELFVNTTNLSNVNGMIYDQNRLYGAIGYRAASNFDMELGYMWQNVNRASPVADIDNHIIQLATYLRL
jgi:hypothetical protein